MDNSFLITIVLLVILALQTIGFVYSLMWFTKKFDEERQAYVNTVLNKQTELIDLTLYQKEKEEAKKKEYNVLKRIEDSAPSRTPFDPPLPQLKETRTIK